MTSKKDRLTAAAVALAEALPGPWAIAEGVRWNWDHEGYASTGLQVHGPREQALAIEPTLGRTWGYHVKPTMPPALGRYNHAWEEYHTAAFKIGTPAAQVAAAVDITVLPWYQDELTKAREAQAAEEQRERERARRHEPLAAVARAMGGTDVKTGDHLGFGSVAFFFEPFVGEVLGNGNDWIRLRISVDVPMADGVAVARALAGAIESGPATPTPPVVR